MLLPHRWRFCLLWWRDFFRVKKLVDEYNETESLLRDQRMPPQSLSFLPPRDELDLTQPPVWASQRDSRGVLVGGTLLLALFGFVMGVIMGATGVFEPSIIMIVFMLVTLIAARWPGMRHVPLLGQLSRWNHRLRLYYFSTDPGSVWLLAARPFIGIAIAPWQKKSRAEVRLYLQIGLAFALVFAAFDLYEMNERGFWVGFGLMMAELGQTIVYTYAFVAPVGAILLTQQLLARKDYVIPMMCLLNLACGYLGLRLLGGI